MADDSFESALSQVALEIDKESALKSANQLFDLSDITPSQKALVLSERGKIYFSLGKLKKALWDFKQLQKISHGNQLLEQEAFAFKMIGVMHYYLGNNDNALSAYQSSLSFHSPELEPIKYANLLSNIGLVYAAIGELSEAIKMYEQAETIYQEKPPNQLGIIRNRLRLFMTLKCGLAVWFPRLI